MNKQYRIVWNESSHTWMAVSEIARSHGKSKGGLSSGGGQLMRLLLKPIAMALAMWGGLALGAPPAANQLPTGGQVVGGQASIQQVGSAMLNVNQSSQSAVINWNSFNLGSAATVNFLQPSSSAAVLNRVLDANPSQIFGRITAQGQVFFSNPNGMYFGKSAMVDVGSLTATTHSISTSDFMAGNYRFTRDGATGTIVNDGAIQVGLGGYVTLLAPEVRNHGVVLAQMGTVTLAAGEAFELQFQGSQLSSVQVTPSTVQALVENGQAVVAPGGLVILSAKAVDQLQGSVINTGDLNVTAIEGRAGQIVLEASTKTQVSGNLLANSEDGQGGHVTITGKDILLDSRARLEAKGTTGGGTVLVGGDWQGSGSLPQATTVTMEAGARIDASATQMGDGGKVVLWSDVHDANGQTTAHGSISARGGAFGGNGGQVETSGHQVDAAGLKVNAGADNGRGGLWLLDPFNYTIDATAASTIKTSLDVGTSVTIDTANSSFGGINGTSGAGAIAINSNIAKTMGGDATLTFKAASSIVLGSSTAISSTSGKLNLVLWTNTGGFVSGSTTGFVQLGASSSISTNGGHVWIGGSNTNGGSTTWNGLTVGDGSAGFSGTGNILGVSFYGAINTGGGHFLVNSKGENTGATNSWTEGVLFENGSSLSTGAGDITIIGTAAPGNSALAAGIEMRGGPVTATTGSISITGIGSSTTTTGSVFGIKTGGASGNIVSSNGSIIITGSAAGGAGSTVVDIQNDISTVSGGGGVSLNGGLIQGSGGLTAAGNTVTFNASGNGAYSGAITGTAGVIKTGGGIQTLSGNNSYTGATTVNAGTLRAGRSNAFGNNSAVTLANVAGTTLDLNNFNVSIGSLAGGGTTGGSVTLGTGTLTTGGNNTSTT